MWPERVEGHDVKKPIVMLVGVVKHIDVSLDTNKCYDQPS